MATTHAKVIRVGPSLELSLTSCRMFILKITSFLHLKNKRKLSSPSQSCFWNKGMDVVCTLVAYATSSAKQPYFVVQQPQWLALHVKIWSCYAVATAIQRHSFWHSYRSSTQLKRCCECAERFLWAHMMINTTATVPLSGELYCTTTEKKYLA